MSHIFLSYAREDRERVRPLVALLKSVTEVWWDQELRDGDNWQLVIEKALEQAACVVVAWTRNSVQKDWVRSEADDAEDRQILVPVLLDDLKLPLAFRHLQTAQLQGWNGDVDHPQAQALKAAVAGVVARTATVQQPPRATTASELGPVLPPQRSWSFLRHPKWLGALLLAAGLVGLVGYWGYVNLREVRRTPPGDLPPGGPKPTVSATSTTSADADSPRAIRGIIISETGSASLSAVSAHLAKNLKGPGYHYMVDLDGSIASDLDESRDAVHTTGHNFSTIGIGMVHASKAYPEEQIRGLVGLLTTLAHDHQLDVRSIQSKEEVDPRFHRDITRRMNEIRASVAKLLGAWRLSGDKPAEAEVRIHASKESPR